MNRTIFPKLAAFTCLLIFMIESSAQTDVVAQVVWHDLIDNEHIVFLSNYDGETWSNSDQLYATENAVSSVVLATSKTGSKLLVWTEQRKNKSVLMHKFYSNIIKQWGEPSLLSDYGYENIGSSIIYDTADQAWIFWGSNDDDLSDIVGMTFSNDQWSDVFSIHDENEVPDILPRSSLDQNGNVIVKWSSFSFDERQYVERSKTYNVKLADTSRALLNDSIEYGEILLPDFIPSKARSLIHFPSNLMIQSEYYIPLVSGVSQY